MDQIVKQHLNNLESPDEKVRLNALDAVLQLTEGEVDWVYAAWDDLFGMLEHPNSFHRSIAIKVICNLAKSDTEDRLSDSLDLLLAHTKDEKFITSRQCLQSIWKLALKNPNMHKRVLTHLEKRYRECAEEKHYNLIRGDIINSIRRIYDFENDEKLISLAQALIAAEQDEKYRKQYQAIMR